MNIKKFSAVFFSAVMIFAMTSCSKKETPEEEKYHFGGAKTIYDVREHLTRGKVLTQNFYLTVNETSGDFEAYTEFYRTDKNEIRLIRYDGYQTRFIREEDKYIIVDDIKETAAVYPYENTHDDIMWSDMDFLISVIDMALSGELMSSGYSEETKDSFTETYKTENGDEFSFWISDGKLKNAVIADKSGKIIATYDVYYDSKGGDKNLFKYKGYKVTDMHIEKTETTTTEE